MDTEVGVVPEVGVGTRGGGWFQEVGEVPEVGVGPRGRGGPKRYRRFEVREVSLMEVVLGGGRFQDTNIPRNNQPCYPLYV